jgi:hypothetical protein
MTRSTAERFVRRAAAAAAARPTFLAWVLARFQESEHLDDAALAQRLGLEPSRLAWLGLCRRPRPTHFSADVAMIAERFGIEPGQLASLFRRVDALAAFAQVVVGQDAGVLAAARDDTEPDPTETPEEST